MKMRFIYIIGLMWFRSMLVFYINYFYRSIYFRLFIFLLLMLEDIVKVRVIDMCEGYIIFVKLKYC